MKALRLRFSVALPMAVLFIGAASPALALANRVFVSARSGNNANSCDNVNTPCQTFAGAVTQLNPNGEVIVLDSGGYGPVTITQSLTIEAPAGVTAFIHPPSGDAVTVNAGSGTVTLRGLTLSVGTNNGITVNSVGTLTVENCFITGFTNAGIQVLGTGVAKVAIDRCHLDGNGIGFYASTTSPGGSTTTAIYSTANSNGVGWFVGDFSTGGDVLNLEFCTGSANSLDGLKANSDGVSTAARYSNCVFSNNGRYGVYRDPTSSGVFETRGNNTITGNASGAAGGGPIGSFSPM